MAKVIFFGTPEYVLPVLEALAKTQEVLAVVTQPPKPIGRKQTLTPAPVAEWAQHHKIPVLTNLQKLPTADVGILAAYGKIIPQEVIDHFPFGIINIHPSLLPKYRGASPVQGALAAGEKETGVTIIKLDKDLDHGPILAQFTEPVEPDDTTGILRDRLFKKAAGVLSTILPGYLENRVTLREQDHARATCTKIIKKEHGFIPGKFLEAALRGETINEPFPVPFIKDLSLSPSSSFLERFIRALSPWPGAWTEVQLTANSEQQAAKRLKILRAHADGERLILDEVQLEGKNPVSWQQFVQGYPEFHLV